MTVTEPDVQWYIARDGKQYGPVSTVEMAKLVELRHLRPNDLVWRPGFADWRPALTVFPPEVAALPQVPLPVSAGQASAATGQPAGTAPDTATARVSPSDIKAAAGTRAAAQPRPQEAKSQSAVTDAERNRNARAGGGGKTALVAVLLLLLAGAGGGYYVYGDRLLSGSGKKAPANTAATVAATAAEPVSVAAVDARVQGLELWQLLKRDYADWYGARMKEIEGLPDDKRTDSGVEKLLVTEMVSLRRKHADQALAASTPRLKRVATAFLDNINELAGRDPNACFSFISLGEASPAVMPGIVRPEGKAAIQTQLVAIFEAIAEGGTAPVQHEKPQKSDYDALAGELTKLGWSQTDLQLFADPKALARATPERVCKMVQDWFTAHIAIADPGVQERLLVETLRPVVSG